MTRAIHDMISFVHGSFWLVYYAWIGGLLTITGLFKFSNYFHLFTFFFYSDSSTTTYVLVDLLLVSLFGALKLATLTLVLQLLLKQYLL